MLTIVEPDDNINLAARNGEILIKQNSKAKVREKWNCIFVKENISQDSETTTDNKKASLKKLEARK